MGDAVFPLRDYAYTHEEVRTGLTPILHADIIPLMTDILQVFFKADFPKTPFKTHQEIKCWQCFFNTLRGNLCAANMSATEDFKQTQLNAIANFLGHHKTSSVSTLYPGIFQYIVGEYPHQISDVEGLRTELQRVAALPDNADRLRSSL